MSNFGTEKKYPMSKDIRIKRGLDIRLKGSAEKVSAKHLFQVYMPSSPQTLLGSRQSCSSKKEIAFSLEQLYSTPRTMSESVSAVRSVERSQQLYAEPRESYWPSTFFQIKSKNSPNSSVRTVATEMASSLSCSRVECGPLSVNVPMQ